MEVGKAQVEMILEKVAVALQVVLGVVLEVEDSQQRLQVAEIT